MGERLRIAELLPSVKKQRGEKQRAVSRNLASSHDHSAGLSQTPGQKHGKSKGPGCRSRSQRPMPSEMLRAASQKLRTVQIREFAIAEPTALLQQLARPDITRVKL